MLPQWSCVPKDQTYFNLQQPAIHLLGFFFVVVQEVEHRKWSRQQASERIVVFVDWTVNIRLDSVVRVDAINSAVENRVVTEHSSMSQDNLIAEIANLFAAYRSYRENPYRLTDKQI